MMIFKGASFSHCLTSRSFPMPLDYFFGKVIGSREVESRFVLFISELYFAGRYFPSVSFAGNLWNELRLFRSDVV
jgi:hypothetical protein